MSPTGLTPSQLRTFNNVLAVGGARPTSPVGLPDELEAKILAGTIQAVGNWTERSLRVSKGQLFSVLRCEGNLKAEAENPERRGMSSKAMVGIVSHRAIQIAHTHPGRSIAAYVSASLEGSTQDEELKVFWEATPIAVQSDMQMQMMSRVSSFLDSWPTLDPNWTPRFEEPFTAKVGKLTLAARADLVLGRPRAEGRQTMILCDLKSGEIQDHHEDEAMFYALVSTLRHGIAPYRSMVYSLASGEATNPEVTAERLHEAADKVIDGVRRLVDVLTERRLPILTPGQHCTWCPIKTTCSASEA